MEIQVKDISKIYGTKESQVAALAHASMTICEQRGKRYESGRLCRYE